MDQRRILIVALARSGYHAIAHWIFSQLDGGCFYLNNCNLELQGRGCDRYPPERHRAWSFENFDLRGFAEVDRTRFDDIILVLRDPYNWIASSLRKGKHCAVLDEAIAIGTRKDYRGRPMTHSRWTLSSMSRVDMFRQYCETAVSSDHPFTAIANYNRWVVDREYRRDLAQTLGLRFTDKGRSDVPRQGNGSSFDHRRFHGSAEGMQVLDRWREYAEDARFRELLTPDLREWSRRLFGFTPDV